MALIALAISAVAASSASAIGIGTWEAGTCKVDSCTYGGSPGDFYSQAAGHPAFGVTHFTVNVEGTDQAKRVKVELPEGLNVNPQSVPQCPVETFKTNEAACAASKVGTSEVTTILIGIIPVTLPFAVYNLVPHEGEPALFGFNVPPMRGDHRSLHGFSVSDNMRPVQWLKSGTRPIRREANKWREFS